METGNPTRRTGYFIARRGFVVTMGGGMSVTFIHSADWQIGKPFARVEDAEKRALIRQERLRAIDRLGEVARARGAAFVIVAGDLFDSATIGKAAVSQACSAIGRIGLPVYAIPGNHDHGGPGGVWDQPFFQKERDELAPNFHPLLRAEPVDAGTALLFPCPLLRRHESADPAGWLRGLGEADLAAYDPAKPRIVIAHGSVRGFDAWQDDEEIGGGGGSANLIDLDRLPVGFFDYIALGDWHGTQAVRPDAWYAGTPEPDRFPKGESNDPGHVLAVRVERGGAAPEVTPVATARLGWHRVEHHFSSEADLDLLAEKIAARLGGRAGEDLLRLSLRGSLSLEGAARLEALIETWDSRLLRLRLKDETHIAPSAAELDALAADSGDPLISLVAGKLAAIAVESADDDAEAAAIARVALRELHAAVNRVA